MQQVGRVLSVFALLLSLGVAPVGAAKERDITAMPKVAAGSVAIGGDYWALLIGIDQYQHVPKLESAVRDVQEVREVLVQRYGFAREKIVELINGQATREGIENALYELRKKTGKNDSIFIYYAGHGQIDQEDQIGYWVPVEGKAQSPGTFISNARIRDEIARMKARHVYLVADSCFSGTLFASSRGLPPLNDKFFQRLYANKSRWALTSGQNEPVTDQGKGGHSMFAYFFLKLLNENEDPYLVPSHIYDQIAPLIGRNTDQQPRSEPLQNAGDEGGQFVFRLAVRQGSPQAGGLAPASAPVPVPGPSDALTQAEQELKSLAEQAQRIEEQKRLAAIEAQIEAKKKLIEDENKKLELAKAYSLPQQAGKETIGQVGAPMVLIPEGSFLMGSKEGVFFGIGADPYSEPDEYPEHHVTLDSYYLDKYEVSNRQYFEFVKATGHRTPKNCCEPKYEVWIAGKPSLGAEELPVINVDWADSTAYCAWAGKRLPTEAEWEKAARGSQGRIYPWGSEPPNPSLANFSVETMSEWQGLTSFGRVDYRDSGQSPYGIYNMAGNVWEWVSDWYEEDYYRRSPSKNPRGPAEGRFKGLRGGSWRNNAATLRAANRNGKHTPSERRVYIGFRCAMDVPK